MPTPADEIRTFPSQFTAAADRYTWGPHRLLHLSTAFFSTVFRHYQVPSWVNAAPEADPTGYSYTLKTVGSQLGRISHFQTMYPDLGPFRTCSPFHWPHTEGLPPGILNIAPLDLPTYPSVIGSTTSTAIAPQSSRLKGFSTTLISDQSAPAFPGSSFAITEQTTTASPQASSKTNTRDLHRPERVSSASTPPSTASRLSRSGASVTSVQPSQSVSQQPMESITGLTGQHTQKLPLIIVAGSTITANVEGEYTVGSKTLLPHGPAITLSGKVYSLLPSATALVVDGRTSVIASDVSEIPKAAQQLPSVSVMSGNVLINGHTLTMSSTLTLGSGRVVTKVALKTNSMGQTVLIGDSTTKSQVRSDESSHRVSSFPALPSAAKPISTVSMSPVSTAQSNGSPTMNSTIHKLLRFWITIWIICTGILLAFERI